MSNFQIELLIIKPCPVCNFHTTRCTEDFLEYYDLIPEQDPRFDYAVCSFACKKCRTILGIVPRQYLKEPHIR